MKKREQNKLARKARIIDVAEKLFFEKGLRNVTMDEIAGRLRYSKATVYSYFSSKDELFFEICQRGNTILQRQLQEAVAQHPLGVDKVRAIGRSFFQFALNYPQYYKFISYFVSGSDFAIDEALEVKMLHLDKVLVDAIQKGIEDGSIREVNPQLVSKCLWAMGTGILDMIFQKGDMMEKHLNIEKISLFETFFQLLEQSLARNLAANREV
ncbi:TetR/AcrR family transcriptional regulator [Raineya orbicola]|jgi:AcrR family transcriptional regulator|uniref:Transcriptional regulator n=1 Tax=Raineya orbicola TaxID=2016530 RepID=A0A2N3ICK4_9BACT|nr:TetR/AcrR family transcriptional regulator [Raineya orbicola]PKQ68046.1 Transcriptional regulator [Raineya orbicola]